MPFLLMTPMVGRKPTTPLTRAGERTEPPVSLPTVTAICTIERDQKGKGTARLSAVSCNERSGRYRRGF